MRFVYKHLKEEVWFIAEFPEYKSGIAWNWKLGAYVKNPLDWRVELSDFKEGGMEHE